jgi:hypothetical protein
MENLSKNGQSRFIDESIEFHDDNEHAFEKNTER